MRRTGVWVSLFRNFIIHEIFSEFLQPLRDFRTWRCSTWFGKQRVSLFYHGILFICFWEFLVDLGLLVIGFSPFYRALLFIWFWILLAWFTTGCPDRSSTIVDTVTGEMSLSIWSSRSLVLLPLDVTVGDEDELEEDVEQWLPCLERVLEVDWSRPEDELAGKPGTAIGTKFSVLQCIGIPFLMRCVFWPLIHS